MEKIGLALKKGDIKEALEIFKTLSQEEQEDFFKKISLAFTSLASLKENFILEKAMRTITKLICLRYMRGRLFPITFLL